MIEQELESIGIADAEEILRLAGQARKRMDMFSREDLIRAAAEMDVSAEAVITAEQFVREKLAELDDRVEFRRKQVKQSWTYIGIGVPVVALMVTGHFFNFFNQAFGILKGMMKGLSGLLFHRATGHEMEFQTWRNERYFKVRYGASKPEEMVVNYMKDGAATEYADLMDWLVEDCAFDPTIAAIAINRYRSNFPSRVPRTRASVHERHAFIPKQTIWNRDLFAFAKRRRTEEVSEPAAVIDRQTS